MADSLGYDGGDEDTGRESTCPACGSEGILLGWLGRLIWFRCRACGITFKQEER